MRFIIMVFNVYLLKVLVNCQIDFASRNKSVIVLPPMLLNYDDLYKDVGYSVKRAAFLKYDGKIIENTIIAGTDCANKPIYIGRTVNGSYILIGAVDSSNTLTVGFARRTGLIQKFQFQVFVNGTSDIAQWRKTTADDVQKKTIKPMIAGHWHGNPRNPIYICRFWIKCGFIPGYVLAESGKCYVDSNGTIGSASNYEIIVLNT